MVAISTFTRNFANGQRYIANFVYTDDFNFPYVSFRINLDAPTGAPIYTESVCLGFSRSGDLCKHAPPATGCRSPLAGQRRANCDQGVLARRTAGRSDPVVGLVPMSDGVGRQTLELLA